MPDVCLSHRTGNPYEARFGYSRAVRRGPFVFVSGTTSVDAASGAVQHPGDAGAQARAAFAEIVRAVEAVGAARADVVRVRMFVTHAADCDAVGAALKDALGDVAPAATMLVGARFVSEEMRVEIEADAVVLAQ
ncbi:YjgF-like protein [Phanerochaete sordida]|uniref:YjgF-like protein n=1 Tax=Phanerochaete sordida TaxID=48140 RepID=A0A9P3L7U4_9APHY|nr:YjgF-like protein [Phanerochaete sordida]